MAGKDRVSPLHAFIGPFVNVEALNPTDGQTLHARQSKLRLMPFIVWGVLGARSKVHAVIGSTVRTVTGCRVLGIHDMDLRCL